MSFAIDEIKTIIRQVLHEIIGEKEFVYQSVPQWHNEILNEILHQLEQLQYKNVNQQVKYVATVAIGEKRKDMKFGLHTALCCLWDGTTDGCITIKWENKNIYSIVNVFGLAA